MRRNARGFSMIELVTAVAISTIMATLAVVGFQQSISATRGRGAVREITTLVTKARNAARNSGQPVRLVLTPFGAHEYRMRYEQLPCDDRWGTTCPATACESNLCGSGGCDCPEVSSSITIPREIPSGQLVSGTNTLGICFAGSSGLPLRGTVNTSTGMPSCDFTATTSNVAQMPTLATTTHGEFYILFLDPLTGEPRLIDCAKGVKDPLCP